MEILKQIMFPDFTGIRCNMMKFIQGDSQSLPNEYQSYASIVNENFLEKGEIGYLTIDEKFVTANNSQRGYNSKGISRNVHIEVGSTGKWGSGQSSWGGGNRAMLEDSTVGLIANSLSNTCRVWDEIENRYTFDGDLGEYINDYPENTGILLSAGQLAKISIFTPHEPISQKISSNRQFFRIIGKGVSGSEPYFTKNYLMD